MCPPAISTPSLHDALPIFRGEHRPKVDAIERALDDIRANLDTPENLNDTSKQVRQVIVAYGAPVTCRTCLDVSLRFSDRKSTRLNSSHLGISYAVFCLNKK